MGLEVERKRSVGTFNSKSNADEELLSNLFGKIENLFTDISEEESRKKDSLKMIQGYKPIEGDAVDELFSQHYNKYGGTARVKRLTPGRYLCGTKTILAKINNDKLVIKVDGGYLGADQFFEQHGKQ